MSTTKTPPAPAVSNSGHNEEITMLIVSAVVIFMLFAMFKFLAWLSIYLYTPFTYLPLKMLLSIGPIGAAIIFVLYALVCIGLDFLIGKRYKKAEEKKINPERSHGFLYLAGYWLIMAVYVFINPDAPSNGFFSLIYYVCQPEIISQPFATCNANFKSVITGSSFFGLMTKSFIPNLIFVIPVIPELTRGFVSIIDHPKNNAVGSKTVQQVINISKENFAHLHFYSKIDPRNYSQDGKSPFALLRQSRHFATEQNLIERFILRPEDIMGIRAIGDKQEIKGSQKALTASDNAQYIPVISSERFEHAMIKQLGNIWTGDVEDLTPSQVMILAMTLRQCCTIEKEMSAEEAESIIKDTRARMDAFWIWLGQQLDKHCKVETTRQWPDGYDLSKLPPLTKYDKYGEYKNELRDVWFKHPVLQSIAKNHAYINTVILDVIVTSRKVGVLQPSSTRWMRLYDRPLFALIQNAGRPSVFAENMGSVSHYYAEKRNGRRLLKPDFQSAYEGFSTRLSGFLYTKDEVELFNKNKLKYTTEYRTEEETFDKLAKSLDGGSNSQSHVTETPDVPINEGKKKTGGTKEQEPNLKSY